MCAMVRVRDVLGGRYELLEVLGRGGMGVVYRANDRVLERVVAVKVLPVDRAENPILVTRFEREARAAAALNHPNIVGVFDSGRDQDLRYIVMEYVDGENLAQLLRRRGPLPPHEVVEIGAHVASALAAAHQAGIVHRDIKPANVMISASGTVKVLDFGIARAAESTSLTQAATVLGSAPYLAPEVSQGQPADARSDIYSLGCVLYEMLTGRPPFTGDLPAAVMNQHITASPRPIRELRPDVPAPLDGLILAMLAKEPSARPQSAGEVAQRLPASLDETVPGAALTPTAPTAPLAGPTLPMEAPPGVPVRPEPAGDPAGPGGPGGARGPGDPGGPGGRGRRFGGLLAMVLAAAVALVVAGVALALLGAFKAPKQPASTSTSSSRSTPPPTTTARTPTTTGTRPRQTTTTAPTRTTTTTATTTTTPTTASTSSTSSTPSVPAVTGSTGATTPPK
jgi:serine/threonine-protein kinase